MKSSFVILTVIAAILFMSPQTHAKTFYLKNGEQIEYKSYQRSDGVIHLLINRDTEIEIPVSEVDLARTAESARKEKKTHPAKFTKHVKRHAVHRNIKHGMPSKIGKIPAPALTPVPHEKPAPVTKSVHVVPVPVKIRQANTKSGSPALCKELDAVFGEYFAAMRSGNSKERLKYVTGEQRRQIEQLEKLPKAQKKQMDAMFREALASGYKVTGCNITPDGKKATLNFTRKVPTVHYELGKGKNGKPAMIQKGKTEYEDSSCFADFVKVGNDWKIGKNDVR